MKLTQQIEIKKSVSDSDKLLFTKHLAIMVKAGLPIDQVFDTLIEQTESGYFRKILKLVLSDISNGQSLTKSLNKYPKIFDDFYVNMIKVGEESGTLSENLDYLAKQLGKNYNLKKKIKNALLYPEIVTVITFIIGGGISIFVLPKLTDLFSSFEVELPAMTKVLLWFANLMKNYGILIFTAIFLLIIIFLNLIRIGPIKFWWNKIILKIPLLGKNTEYGQFSQFTRNLGILLKAGMPIDRSLDITADTISNEYYKYLLKKLSKLVIQGIALSDALKEKGFKAFPILISKMINVGEKTGKLDEVLIYLADYYEEEMDNISKNLSTTLEPIMLIVIGLVVAFVALSIIMPIYQLTGNIG